MRNRTLALMALLASTGSVKAQTVLWSGNTQEQPRGTGTQVYQAPSGEIFIEPGARRNQPADAVPGAYYDRSPTARQPGIAIDPQTGQPIRGNELYVPPAPGEGTPDRPALIWQVSPQPPQTPVPPQPTANTQPDLRAGQRPPPPQFEPPLGGQLDASAAPSAVAESGVGFTQRPDAVREFAAELTGLIRLAERYRAASPGFLEDLNELAAKYESLPLEPIPTGEPTEIPGVLAGGGAMATTAESEGLPEGQLAAVPRPPELTLVTAPAVADTDPAQLTEQPGAETALPPTSASIVYLRDDFADGEFELSPPWTVRQGNWRVDERFGLRPNFETDTGAAPATPGDLLKFLLGENARGQANDPASTVALIESETAIGNAFSLVANITDHEGRGAAHFIMHQGAPNWLGYRLELRGGSRPLVVLTRRGASGYKDIMKVEAPGFSQGETHQLRWARLADGQMFVLLDGRPLITARDTVFRQGWGGFGFFVANGDMSLRNVRIAEPVEQ